jgi:8-oxo-dGTP pyrophosphatase MutT (NUDIX family)
VIFFVNNMEQKNNSVTVIKSIGVFIQDGKTLASKGFDKKKNETFYRGIGGGIHFRETSQDAMKREIKEELGCEVENLKLVDVAENIFTFDGEDRHQIIFLYTGDLSNKDLYKQNKIHIVEPYSEFDAEWVPIDDILSGKVILYPSLDWAEIFNK